MTLNVETIIDIKTRIRPLLRMLPTSSIKDEIERMLSNERDR